MLQICAVFFYSCKKEITPPEEPSVYWGTVHVDKNGVPWIVSPAVSIHTKFKNTINLTFTEFDQYGFKKEKSGMFKVPAHPGTYSLHKTSIQVDDGLVGSNFFFNDDDFLLGYYDVLEADSSSFLTITSYDTVTKEMKGKFEVIFKVTQRPYPGAPDTIRLQNGVFHTKVL